MSYSKNNSCPVCLESNSTYQGSYGQKPFLSCNSLYKCSNCNLVFAYEFPKKDDLNEYYSNSLYYDLTEDPFHPEIIEFSYKLALTRLSLIYEKTNMANNLENVIDIGAGNAVFGLALKKQKNEVIYDVVEPNIQVQDKYGDWVNNSYTDINQIKRKSYDLVILNQVLEHIPDPINFLKSISKFIKNGGYLYIDVPFQDYLFKKSIEPHLIFLNHKSISFLMQNVGLKMVFCDTAGMPHKIARRFFNQHNLLRKILNPWKYLNKINQIVIKIGFSKIFDTFNQFQADQYGGDRQWLRCIAQKID